MRPSQQQQQQEQRAAAINDVIAIIQHSQRATADRSDMKPTGSTTAETLMQTDLWYTCTLCPWEAWVAINYLFLGLQINRS